MVTEPHTLHIHFYIITFLLRNGIERLRAGLGVLNSTEGIRFEPK